MTARTTAHQTRITADPALPTIRIVREFDAPRERVYRAWTDPELVTRWLGPHDIVHVIDVWDARTGGSWRYHAVRDGETVASFFGSFHELRAPERLVQTFTFEGFPDGVSLETLTLESIDGGRRTRATTLGVVESLEARDAILASGMEQGVVEGYAKLDALL